MQSSFINDNAVFTLTQALQLVGLAPCLFVIAFLLTTVLHNRQSIVPILYFLALSCSFVLPLLELYPSADNNIWVKAGVLMGESLLIAFAFLLIFQFIIGRIPPWPYWLVLALPLVGGGLILYANMIQASESCSGDACYDVETTRTLYHIVSSSVLFLLLIVQSSKIYSIVSDEVTKRHKYWLVISLICLHLLLLGVELVRISGRINASEAALSETILKLTFIYLVLTSLFRVFYPTLAQDVRAAAHAGSHDPALDAPHVNRISELLDSDKIYREMRLNRAALAEKLAIGEHHLSRIINHHFGKNFNELINTYRIEEAKTRLTNEPQQQVTVIGFEVGFNSIASFNRVFKEKTGMSPTEWRTKK